MRLLYDLFIQAYMLGIRLSALFGNTKAILWIEGRKNWKKKLAAQLSTINYQLSTNTIWFHCASTGEFEQGRPLIEKLKMQNENLKIVLTFFSPSGYAMHENYKYADHVFYLPLDTTRNARAFIGMIRPTMVFFIKYDYWYHYLRTLKKRNIPVYVASAIFREEQRFFKWYGGFFTKMLGCVKFFFLQNEKSAALLNSIGFTNHEVTGDTRFDRVIQIASQAATIEKAKKFKGDSMVVVAGSTWHEDEELLLAAIKKFSDIKWIIVPHEISHRHIGDLEYNLIEKAKFTPDDIAIYTHDRDEQNARVLIVDTVGLLSSLYRYGEIAYVGGGFGNGIHNILEAAVYGMPVIFGPGYDKFQEAKDLISLGGAFAVANTGELTQTLSSFIENLDSLHQASQIARQYVYSHSGATDKILKNIFTLN